MRTGVQWQIALAAIFLFIGSAAGGQSERRTFAVLHADGRAYTNAHIVEVTPIEMVIRFDGGGARIHLTNLPPELQEEFPYDAAAAEAYRAEQSRRQAARIKRLREQQSATARALLTRSEPKVVTVVSLHGVMGYDRCTVEIEDEGRREILITLPSQVKPLFDAVARQEAAVEAFAVQVKAELEAAEDAMARLPDYVSGSPEYVHWIYVQRQRAVAMSRRAKQNSERLEEMKQQLQNLRAQKQAASQFVAAKTGKTYSNLEVWEYVGPVVRMSEPSE